LKDGIKGKPIGACVQQFIKRLPCQSGQGSHERMKKKRLEIKMANKSMFASVRGKLLPAASILNAAGGKAFELSPRQTLAQLAVTGCLNGTF